LCRLSGVPYTEPVTVGDDVVSLNIDGVNAPRMYFGKVTQAEFLAGGQWQIVVTPAIADATPLQAAVVRMNLHPATESGAQPNSRTSGRGESSR
ncbi:MAG: hypothetical protein KDA96_03900, partial [Planctomycetaceae bacterium]|nr:hypothetical protein [Planctomycetaceae bacterium]